MDVTATINGLSLIGSGTALLTNAELKLQAHDLPITILFKADSGTPRWATEGSETDGVFFTLFNMTNRHGEGIFKPVSIAKSPEVEYFLTLYVTSLNQGELRVLVYNVLEKRADI